MQYQLFPRLTGEEYAALKRDIEERGVVVPVIVDEDGHVLDGHHRVEIASALGIDYPLERRAGLTESEKLELVFSLNIARRHLSGHDRTAVIAQGRSRGMSLRAIAAVVGVHNTTVMRQLRKEGAANAAPDVDAPEPEPLPTLPTRAERIAELLGKGWTQAAIAAELGLSPATVSNVINNSANSRRASAPDAPVDWGATKRVFTSLKELVQKDSRAVAATVPVRFRQSEAKRLRKAGKFLTDVAYALEVNSL